MSAHLLIEHFHLLAAGPGGVPKLRELILNLAVRGKLVPQDPSDEPASELLKRVQAEKARLVAEGKIKKDKPLPEIGEGEIPYELPQGWQWSRMADISRDWGQKTPNNTFSYIDVSAINNSTGIIEAPSVVMPADAPSRARKLVEVGTVIYSTVRPYLLNIAVIDREFDPEPIVSTAFAIVHPLGCVSSRYIFWYLRSPCFKSFVESVQTGIAYPAINDSQFFSGLIPLPPLAEQSRIVAKVDELMALCDALEKQQGDQTEAHAQLVSTLLDTLTQSADAAAFADNWARLAEHFEWLFDTPESIDQLKKTILQLAVQGKLVPQDPNDEPASELLKKIVAEKARLVAEGKIKKDKSLQESGEDEKPYKLPQGWLWSRLSTVSVVNPRNDVSDNTAASFVPMAMIETRFDGRHQQEPRKWGEIKQGFTHFAEGDIGVAKITPCFENSKACVFTDLNNGVGAGTTELHIIRPLPGTLVARYVLAYLKSPMFLKVGEGHMTGTAGQKRLPKDFVESNPFPLPPLAEQSRIVAKVDELMAVCDALSEKLTGARTLNQQLLDTLVEQAA